MFSIIKEKIRSDILESLMTWYVHLISIAGNQSFQFQKLLCFVFLTTKSLTILVVSSPSLQKIFSKQLQDSNTKKGK